jgi:calcineurin-like phosphoesterase
MNQKAWDLEIRKVELQHEMDGLDILKVEKQLAAYKEVILDLNQHQTAEVAQLHVKVRDGRQQLVVGSHTRICFVAA